MNTPPHNDHDDLRHAEYVLGVLGAAERAEVLREARDDPGAAEVLAWWQQRLTPLGEEIAAVEPPAYVWARIQDALGHTAAPTTTPPRRSTRRRVWDSLSLWRGWGIAATVVAAACLVVLLTLPRPGQQPQQAAQYMVSSIQQTQGGSGWAATLDVGRARMILIPTGRVTVPTDRSTELWLIPPGHKPISVGVISSQHTAVLPLPSALLARLGPKAVFAVSVEPLGGSPTGQPTGAVIAKGAIRVAAAGRATKQSG